MAKKKTTGTKTLIFTKKPPQTAYFVGIEQEVPAKEADELIKQGWAIDPDAKESDKSK